MGWREPTIAAATAAILVTALSWPAVRHTQAWLIGASHNDGNAILWGLHHIAQHFADGRFAPLHTDALFFPHGATMLVSNLPEVAILAPITLTFGAIAAFNIWTLAHHSLSAAATWWCVRRHGGTRCGAALASIAFAFAPVMAGTTFNQNPDVSAWYWIPITAGLVWRATDHRVLWMASTAVGIASWCNPYGGVMAGLTWVALAPHRPFKRWLLALIPMLLIAGTAVILYHHGATAPDSMTTKALRNNLTHGVATWGDLVQRHPSILAQDSTWKAAVHAHYPYLGWVLLPLGIIGWLRLRQARWLTILGCSLLLAVGPGGVTEVPFVHWTMDALDRLTPLGRLHLGHRYTALAVFGLALGAAMWMRQWRTHWQVMAVVLVGADFLQPTLTAGLYQPTLPYTDGSCELLSDMEPGAVFDIPGERGEQWLYAAICHDRPIAAGLNRALSPQLRDTLMQLSATEQAQALQTAGFRYVVIHSRSPRQELQPFTQLTRLLAGCTARKNRAGARVIDLDNCPQVQ